MSISATEGEAETYQYPPDIIADIRVVIHGLFHIYTGFPELIVDRIEWPAPSDPLESFSSRVTKPHIHIQSNSHIWNLSGKFHRCPVKKWKHHDEREYHWLEAFLKVVAWMEEAFGHVGYEPSKPPPLLYYWERTCFERNFGGRNDRKEDGLHFW
jgi:hypothetical protein